MCRFYENELVQLAQQTPKFRQLHDLLQVVCADARVQLVVRNDLVPWRTQAATRGAPALAANVTICVAVLRRMHGLELPDDDAGIECECRLEVGLPIVFGAGAEFSDDPGSRSQAAPKTIRLIHEVVVEWGDKLGVTQARKLRVDGSVTETNIHYPTDSGLLDDAARVLSRLVQQARELLQPRSAADKLWFRDRHRQAHHLARDISRLSRSKAKNTAKSSLKLYKKLLAVVQALLTQVAEIQPRLRQLHEPFGRWIAGRTWSTICPLVQQVIAQTQAASPAWQACGRQR